MQWQLLFFSMAPAVAYAVLATRGQPARAVGVALAVSAGELVVNSVRLGMLEPFSLASFVLFALTAAASYQRGNPRLVELQPVALELLVAAVLAYAYFVRGVPLLAVIARDYVNIDAVLPPYQHGYAEVYATTLSRSLPFVLVGHAALTAFGALERSTWWWLNVRVFGFYAMVLLLFVVERATGVTP
jgi:intracellular septation protein A